MMQPEPAVVEEIAVGVGVVLRLEEADTVEVDAPVTMLDGQEPFVGEGY